jgi:hypothetical protein
MKDSNMHKRTEAIRSTEPPLSPASASNTAEALSAMAML